MDKNQFNAIFSFIIADLIKTIVDTFGLTVKESISLLYNSELYKKLEDERTKVWHYSTPLLIELLEEEITIGSIGFSDV